MRLLLATILLALPISAYAYTSPGNPQGLVSDFVGVLSTSQERELESMLVQYEQQTGQEISVAIIDSFGDETPETYAVRLFEQWGIGKAGQDNGALFVVAINDRQMRIEVGYGLEGDLTDVEANHLTDVVVPPYFRTEDYDGGVRAAVVGMLSAIGADIEVGATSSNRNASTGTFFSEYFFVFIFLFIWLGSVFARSRSWWAGGVVGGVGGLVAGITIGAWLWLPILIVAGLVFDYLVSTKYKKFFSKEHHNSMVWPLLFLMGGRPGRRWDKGGFGGFGGGLSGGGGASGDW